jgi:hypothetical protein
MLVSAVHGLTKVKALEEVHLSLFCISCLSVFFLFVRVVCGPIVYVQQRALTEALNMTKDALVVKLYAGQLARVS